MNEVVARIDGSSALAISDEEEKSLWDGISVYERQAVAVQITNDMSYAAASKMLTQAKAIQKKVKDYWEPLRIATKKPYDEVLDRKKKMLDPIEKAEKILKKKIGDYTIEQQRKAREIEEQRRREAEAEIDRKLAEAATLEAQGDAVGADFAMAEAEVYDQYAANVTVQAQAPKAEGVSVSKTWAIRTIDPSKVPIVFNGVELRPVDEKAVLRLIKSSKGQIAIPGVEIEESSIVSVRAL